MHLHIRPARTRSELVRRTRAGLGQLHVRAALEVDLVARIAIPRPLPKLHFAAVALVRARINMYLRRRQARLAARARARKGGRRPRRTARRSPSPFPQLPKPGLGSGASPLHEPVAAAGEQRCGDQRGKHDGCDRAAGQRAAGHEHERRHGHARRAAGDLRRAERGT